MHAYPGMKDLLCFKGMDACLQRHDGRLLKKLTVPPNNQKSGNLFQPYHTRPFLRRD